MGKTLIAAANSGNAWTISTASTSWFLGIGGGHNSSMVSTTNEARFQMKMPAAGTLRHLSAYIATNGRTTNTTVKTRINGVTGNCVITYGSGVTGRQTDSSNSDSVAQGDLVNFIITTSTGSGSFTPTVFQIEFETTSGTTTVFTYNFNPSVGLSAAEVDVFPVDGLERLTIWGQHTDDYQSSRSYMGCAGTISNLRAFVITQSMDINPTVEIYKNGSATGVKVTLTSALGAFEDTTHTVSVAAGDYLQFKITSTGRTSGTLVLANVTTTFTSGDQKTPLFSMLQQNLAPTNVGYTTGTNYGGFGTSRQAGTTESQHDMLASFICTISHLQTGWINNSAGNETLTLRKNGTTDTALTVTMASGIFAVTNTVDTTHSVSYAANDTFSTKAVTGSTTSGPFIQSIVLDSSTGETGTAALAFGGIAFSAAGTDSHSGTARLAFSGISIAGTSADSHTGTGRLAFSGISFPASGAVTHVKGTGVLSFGGIAFHGVGALAVAGPAALAFGGMSIAATGYKATNGNGVLSFGAFAIIGNGTDITPPLPPVPPPATATKLHNDPLTWNVPIVNADGTPNREFMLKWQKQNTINGAVVGQDYIDTQDAAGQAASQQYTQNYGATVLSAAKAYSDTHLAPVGVYTVATLPASPRVGDIAKVRDATVTTPGTVVIGGGSARVSVWWDGAWYIG